MKTISFQNVRFFSIMRLILLFTIFSGTEVSDSEIVCKHSRHNQNFTSHLNRLEGKRMCSTSRQQMCTT